MYISTHFPSVNTLFPTQYTFTFHVYIYLVCIYLLTMYTFAYHVYIYNLYILYPPCKHFFFPSLNTFAFHSYIFLPRTHCLPCWIHTILFLAAGTHTVLSQVCVRASALKARLLVRMKLKASDSSKPCNKASSVLIMYWDSLLPGTVWRSQYLPLYPLVGVHGCRSLWASCSTRNVLPMYTNAYFCSHHFESPPVLLRGMWCICTV